MKKLLLLLICSCTLIASSAQLITKEELDALCMERYGRDLNSVKSLNAAEIAGLLPLNDAGEMVFTKIAEFEGKSQEELFDAASAWAASTFTDAQSSIKLNDRNSHTLILQGWIPSVISHVGWNNNYTTSLLPVLKIETKEGRARITLSYSTVSVARVHTSASIWVPDDRSQEIWQVRNCFPYFPNDDHYVTSGRTVIAMVLSAGPIVARCVEALAKTSQADADDDW